MNKNQVNCSGVYEYRESNGSNFIFVNILSTDEGMVVYFPLSRKYKKMSEIPDSAIFSRWI